MSPVADRLLSAPASVPAMSVILITPSTFSVIRTSIRHLRDQSVRDQLELVIVCPSKAALQLEEAELGDFLEWRVVEVGEIVSTGDAQAAGVVAARAPVVVYVEEHSYPQPGWAEALIGAHRAGWDAVGGVLENANPATAVSWASLFTDFAPWVAPGSAGEVERLPPHHTSYKRQLLLAYGRGLGRLMETEGVLQADLRSHDRRHYLEPAAVWRHVNPSRLSSYLIGEFLGGRLFAAGRAKRERWPVIRRLLYIAGSPFIPFVRLRRIVAWLCSSEPSRAQLPRAMPALGLALIAHTVGEVTGYAVGTGGAARSRTSVELRRFEHVRVQDKPSAGTSSN